MQTMPNRICRKIAPGSQTLLAREARQPSSERRRTAKKYRTQPKPQSEGKRNKKTISWRKTSPALFG
jgi:hypothetical protein